MSTDQLRYSQLALSDSAAPGEHRAIPLLLASTKLPVLASTTQIFVPGVHLPCPRHGEVTSGSTTEQRN